jgi:hypothetical protein
MRAGERRAAMRQALHARTVTSASACVRVHGFAWRRPS